MLKHCHSLPSEGAVESIVIRRGSRKRYLQDVDYYSPCKRLRADVNFAGNTRRFKSPMSVMNSSSIATNVFKSDRSYRPRHCIRYRRPLTCDWLSNNDNAMYPPFGTARDVSHILRQCHDKVCARESNAGVDNLFGSEYATLQFPSCTFRGWTPPGNINSLTNARVPIELNNSIVHSSPVELEDGTNCTSNYANVNKEELTPKKIVDVKYQCKLARSVGVNVDTNRPGESIDMVDENDGDDILSVARDDKANVPKSPSNRGTRSNESPRVTSCGASEPSGPLRPKLPFHVMPNPSDTPIVSRRRTTPYIAGRGSITLRRIPAGLYASPRLGKGPYCSFISFHSPVRRHTIKRPMMAQYPSSCPSPIRPRVSRGASISPYLPSISLCASPRLLSSPFSSKSRDDSMDQSDVYSVRSGQTTPALSLRGVASIGKRILSHAERLLGRTEVQVSGLKTSPSPISFCLPSPTPPTSQHRLRKRECPGSSKLPVPVPRHLPFRSGSNRAFLSSNSNAKSTIRNECAVQVAASFSRSVKLKKPTSIFPCPPKGWEGLFQPKPGEWTCKACLNINPSEAKNCDSCTAFIDRSTDNASNGEGSYCDNVSSAEDGDRSLHLDKYANEALEDTRYEATVKRDNDGIENSIATRPSSILRNGKSQCHGTASNGKRFKQDCAHIDMMMYEDVDAVDMDLG